jgi:hypothetical protein
VSRGTLDTSLSSYLSRTGLLPSVVSPFQALIPLDIQNHYAGPQPRFRSQMPDAGFVETGDSPVSSILASDL